jgi:hypothetical protein
VRDADPVRLAGGQGGTTVKILALLRTSQNRGDHAADITVPFEPMHNESLLAFVERIANYGPGMQQPLMKPEAGDHIELFIVQEPKR